MYLAFFVVVPMLLSACGGASTDNTSSQPSGPTNKLEASSTATSVAAPNSLLTTSSSQSSQSQSNIGLDVTPPTTIQLQIYQLTENSITLTWEDAAGISHYEISRNGEFIARVDYPAHTLVDQELTPYTNYNYTITAFDLTNKESASSQIFSLRTLAASGGTSSKPSFNSQPDSSTPSIGTTSSVNPKTSSSLSNISSKSSLSRSSISSKSNSSRSSSPSSKSAASSIGQQVVTISWNHPHQRENGTFLELEEIGGYEIRYREPTGNHYTYITLDGNHTTEYTFPNETQDWEFEIAVFDKSGIYSRFVKVTR